MDPSWRLGLRTQAEERRDVELAVEGSFPSWLEGTFIVNGPGQFEVGGTALEHWFDALAMLRGFRFSDGSIRYTNRFVGSKDFRVAREEGRIRRSLPGTPADASPPARLYRAATGAFQDNPSIGVVELDGDLYAVTESPIGIQIDPETLETTGRRDLTAGLDATVTLGHTHVDDGVQWGLAARFGAESTYTLFRRDPGGEPTPLTRLVFDSHPPYLHSFALTERFVVVPEPPFGVDFRALGLRLPFGATFLDAFGPRDAPPRFHLLDRGTGERVAVVHDDPFLIYHIANAFERDGAVLLDAVVFEDDTAVSGLSIENLRSESPDLPQGDFIRFTLPLDGGDAGRELLRRGPVEFPTINYGASNGRPYRYAYLAATDRGSLPTGIAKVDVTGPTAIEWADPHLHPGEPLFVPAPSRSAEDDGVLLSLGIDTRAERSVLCCLDAETLSERGRATLPHRLPYGFHGQFYGPVDPGRSMA